MEINHSSQEPSGAVVLFMWSLLLLGYLLNFFHSFAIAVLQPHLMQEFNIDALAVTSIGSMYFYWYLVMQVPVGLLLDKFGVHIVATTGTLLAALGAALFAIATDVWLLYVGRSLIGIGTSVMFICILQFQMAWFKPSSITTMTGITCFVGTLGGIIAQSPLAYAVETFGWRASLYTIALASLINALAIGWFVKNHPPREQGIDTNKSSIFKGLFVIISSGRTWVSLSLYAMFFGSFVLIAGYIGTAWLEDVYGMNAINASTYIISGILGSAIGFPLIGFWSDRIGRKKMPMLVSGFFYLAVWGFLSLWGNDMPLWLIPILLFCLGFFSCSYVVCWACVQGTNPKECSGIAAAVINMGGFIGPIVLPFIFVQIQNSFALPASPLAYEAAFRGIFGLVLAGLVCGFFVKEPKTQ